MTNPVSQVGTPALILVIEDSPTQGMYLQSFLQQHGFQALCAWNGKVGMSMAHQLQPGLIVLDMQMPDMSGLEVCRRLKQANDTTNIPIIIFTSNQDPDMITQSMASGAADYIPKDVFANSVLLETLRRIGFAGGHNTGGTNNEEDHSSFSR